MPVNGRRVPVVLGYQNPQDYLTNRYFMGVIAGRVANRVSGAEFCLDGRAYNLSANDPPNHLHGGARGVHAQNWAMDPDGTRAVRLHLVSPDGDQGYPGRLSLEVTISLQGHTLTYDMRAETDRPTPVNLAQHSYYNLMGQGTVHDHRLQVSADHFTPADAILIPTGQIQPLEGRDFDLRQPKTLQQADPGARGLDMNFVLSDAQSGAAVTLTATNGLQLCLMTDQPCLQLFTGRSLGPIGKPLTGQTHAPFSGLCLEPQQYPNALNTPGFPSIMILPDHPYRQILKVRIAPEGTA